MFPTCVSQAHDAIADPDAPIACRVEEVNTQIRMISANQVRESHSRSSQVLRLTQKQVGRGNWLLQKMVDDHANGSDRW